MGCNARFQHDLSIMAATSAHIYAIVEFHLPALRTILFQSLGLLSYIAIFEANSQRSDRNKFCRNDYHQAAERNRQSRESNVRPPILKTCTTELHWLALKTYNTSAPHVNYSYTSSNTVLSIRAHFRNFCNSMFKF